MIRFLLIILLSLPGLDWAGGMALNPAVSPSTIGQTICSPGWTKGVRPPVHWTNLVKGQMLIARGLSEADMPLYELDHIVPLELGGAPHALANLQLQLWTGADGAREKDKVETYLHRLVCAHRLSLRGAQACIFSNWQTCKARIAQGVVK